MTITGLVPVKKSKVKVMIDGQFAFVLYKGELSRFHLAEGEELDPSLYEKIRTEVVLKRIERRALHLLEDMPRTEYQLRQKLQNGDYPSDLVEQAIAYVKSFGYLDDEVYARNFVENRKNQKSRKELYGALAQKGISRELIQQTLDQAYDTEDAKEAIQNLMRKRHYDPATADEEQKQKLMAYLTRKGFSYGEIRKTLTDF